MDRGALTARLTAGSALALVMGSGELALLAAFMNDGAWYPMEWFLLGWAIVVIAGLIGVAAILTAVAGRWWHASLGWLLAGFASLLIFPVEMIVLGGGRLLWFVAFGIPLVLSLVAAASAAQSRRPAPH